MTELECKICKLKKPNTELYIGIECYDCWEKDIDEKKVKELRESLNQYVDIDKFKLKENLSLGQLKEVRKIVKDNYVEGSDTIGGKASKEGGKELIKAFWKTGEKIGWQPYKCLKEINSKIEKLEPKPKPVIKKYVKSCPKCGEEFFCELDETLTSKKEEADDILNEQVNEHVKSFHKPQEKKRKVADLPGKKNDRDKANNANDFNDTYQQGDSKSNKSDGNKNTFVILVVIGVILLLVGGGIFAYLHWKKKQNS